MTIQDLLDKLPGMSVGAAEEMIRKAKRTPRRVSTDGKPHVVTRDYRTDRVNLAVAGGKVIRAYVG